LRVYPIFSAAVKVSRTKKDLGRPQFLPFISKGRDLSKAKRRRAGSLRFGFDWGNEVYPAHLEGFVLSKVGLRHTGSLRAIMCILFGDNYFFSLATTRSSYRVLHLH
jgi:hypothetical protein